MASNRSILKGYVEWVTINYYTITVVINSTFANTLLD